MNTQNLAQAGVFGKPLLDIVPGLQSVLQHRYLEQSFCVRTQASQPGRNTGRVAVQAAVRIVRDIGLLSASDIDQTQAKGEHGEGDRRAYSPGTSGDAIACPAGWA